MGSVVATSGAVASAPQQVGPQQPALSPDATRRAASPYFFRTVVVTSPVPGPGVLRSAALIDPPRNDQESLMRPSQKKRRGCGAPGPASLAAACGIGREPGRGQGADECLELCECVDGERVVRPASLAAVRDEAGVLEHPQVKGEQGLAEAERIGELADAPFASPEQVDDLEASRVRQCPELPGDRTEVERIRRGHRTLLYQVTL